MRVDALYIIHLMPRPVQFQPIVLPNCQRGQPLTREQWKSHIDAKGHIVNEIALRSIIFHGGVEPSIRKDVWKYLLHHRRCDPPYACSSPHMHASPTFAEHNDFVSGRRDAYFQMKAQWRTVTPKQLSRNKHLQEQITRPGHGSHEWPLIHFFFLSIRRIAKDIPRTDREHPYFAEDNSPHSAQLNDVLMTYCVYNTDLGLPSPVCLPELSHARCRICPGNE